MTRRLRDAPYLDPTVAGASEKLFGVLWDDIEALVRSGVPYPMARERVLAGSIYRIRKQYGDATADRIVKAMQHAGPEFLTKETQRHVAADQSAYLQDAMRREFGRIGLVNRIWFRLTGWPLYWPRG